MKCFHSASIITITRIKFHIYYQYTEKLKNENRQNLGYDIKNGTNVTLPPSYYEYTKKVKLNGVNTENGENKIFTYKFIKFSSLKQCLQELIDIINPNTQQVLNDMNPTKLTDKVFL